MLDVLLLLTTTGKKIDIVFNEIIINLTAILGLNIKLQGHSAGC